MSDGYWSRAADRALGDLFRLGQPAPTREQIRDAYPFGERAYWPYKVWCKRVKAWIAAHEKGMAAQPPARTSTPRLGRRDGETIEMFDGGDIGKARA